MAVTVVCMADVASPAGPALHPCHSTSCVPAQWMEGTLPFFSASFMPHSREVLVTQSCLFVTPWTVAYQAPLSMELFRQEYWNG